MNEIIRTEHLTKQYREVTAVSDLSISVGKGEIYGFLGLNGAGKTTTIRMLLGMISASSGKAFINGKAVSSGNTGLWEEIGYLVEIPYAYPDLTVRENLEIFRRMRGLKDKQSVAAIIDRLKLTPYAGRKARQLSLGNAQRLGLAKALIHNPKILILDEPANGLDPAGIYEIREMLADLAHNQGVTVFISSHILGEISRVASRIGIIHEGKLVTELGTAQLESLFSKQLLVGTCDNVAAATVLEEVGIDHTLSAESELLITRPDLLAHPEQLTLLLTGKGLPPVRLSVVEEDLESFFLRTIGLKNKPS